MSLKNMFLVKDRRLGMDNYVFTRVDPRFDGYPGEVEENVELSYDMNEIHLWPEGQDPPSPELGRDPIISTKYEVFRSPKERDKASFQFVSGNTPFVVHTWSDYRKKYYPVPQEYAESMTSDEWFEFLEETDVATKTRGKRSVSDVPQPDSTLEEIATWVARRHMEADGGIHQIWYLPTGAPADEIRLLEVSERFTGSDATIEPIDFGLEVNNTNYKLLVADISEEQLERVQSDPVNTLPKDWKLEDCHTWGRRELQK